MKMKFLIGTVCIIVAGIYVVKKLMGTGAIEVKDDTNLKTSEKNAESSLSGEETEKNMNESDNPLSTTDDLKNEMNRVRAETERNISERHKEAANIIRESATNILNDSAEDNKKLDEINNDLNNM